VEGSQFLDSLACDELEMVNILVVSAHHSGAAALIRGQAVVDTVSVD